MTTEAFAEPSSKKFYTLDEHCKFLSEDEWNTVDKLVRSNIYKETTHRGQKDKNAYTTAMHLKLILAENLKERITPIM